MKNIFIAFLLFLVACVGETDKTLPVVTINDKLEKRSLKLSEIADVERIVRLETSNDILIPENFVPLTSNKYIVIQDDQQIRQFSPDGKFIRVLAASGKGPQEYYSLSAITLNPHKEILYFTHSGDREYIQVMDLNSGERLEKIKLPSEFLTWPDRSRVFKLMVMNDTTLTAVAMMTATGNPFAVFHMTTSGKLLGRFATQEKFNSFYTAPPYAYCDIISGKIHFVGVTIDTVYEIQNDRKIPLFYLDIENEFKEPAVEGNKKSMNFEGSSFAIMNTRQLKFFRNGVGGDLMFKDPKEAFSPFVYYFVDYKNYTSYQLSGFDVDWLGFPADISSLKKLNGNFVLPIKADIFKQQAKKVLRENTASPEVMKRVKELDAQITENDNPILVIGKLK